MCKSRKSSRTMGVFPSSDLDTVKSAAESDHDDCFPFSFDDCNGSVASPSFLKRRASTESIKGFAGKLSVDKRDSTLTAFDGMDPSSRYGSSSRKTDNASCRLEIHGSTDAKPNDPLHTLEQRSMNVRSRGKYFFFPFPPMFET